jgi:hypothetical protein
VTRIAKNFPELQKLFPPAGGRVPTVSEIAEELTPVHQVLNGTSRLDQFFEFSGSGAVGVLLHTSGGAPEDKYWFCFACSGIHNDAVARCLTIELIGDAFGHTLSAAARAQPQNVPLAVPRSFIIPPRCAVRLSTPALGAGNVITLRFLYLELDLGEPAPPSP